jgi:hypothetical protein
MIPLQIIQPLPNGSMALFDTVAKVIKEEVFKAADVTPLAEQSPKWYIIHQIDYNPTLRSHLQAYHRGGELWPQAGGPSPQDGECAAEGFAESREQEKRQPWPQPPPTVSRLK